MVVRWCNGAVVEEGLQWWRRVCSGGLQSPEGLGIDYNFFLSVFRSVSIHTLTLPKLNTDDTSSVYS